MDRLTRDGERYVVAAGNSGAEIAFELSGPDVGRIPVRTGSVWDRLLTPPVWWLPPAC